MNEISKTQEIRALDILALGPLLVWAAYQTGPLPRWTRCALLASGILTIVYNAENYRRQQAVYRRQEL